ncbi:MAG: T9SS type A sorting domain-containing protein [Crocinitomicaceae bacterium]|nr:T9SS type A sorting domain-containing protein [Crocinitomicaceae bacterium]
MKKLLLSALFAMTYGLSWGQSCTPGTNFVDSTYGIWPDTTQNFPPADPNVAYSTDINFKVPSTVTAEIDPSGQFVGSVIQQFTIDAVQGLPPGFDFACNISNCTYLGGANGCANLYGTTDSVAVFPVTVDITATVLVVLFPGLPPTPVTQTVSFDGYKIVVGSGGTIDQVINPLSLQPNPAAATIEVAGLFAGGSSVVTLRDLSGKTIEVLQTNASSVTFDLSKLASGSYLIELTDTFGTQQQKFVKL